MWQRSLRARLLDNSSMAFSRPPQELTAMPRLRNDVSRRTLMRSISLLWIVAGGLTGCAWMFRQATSVYLNVDDKFKPKHVKIELLQSFVERNRDRVQIVANFKVDKAMGSPLPAPIDGDLHFAGR